MFGIGGWEFVVISVLALLLFGPDKLPQFARTLGRFMRDFKRYQAMMESTIRAEVFAAEEAAQKEAFEKGKGFREKVAGETFSSPESAEDSPEPAAETTEADDTPDSAITPPVDGEGERDEA